MKKDLVNKTHVEGYVFSHNLEERITGEQSKTPGKTYISGEINIATDDSAVNVIPVRFFAYETWPEKRDAQGNVIKPERPNDTFATLKQIIDTGTTYEQSGTAANKVRIDGNVDVNDFYSRDGELASPKRVSGSFCHFMTEPVGQNPATFEMDMLITSAAIREVEDGDDYINLSGNAFNFRGDLLPVTVSVRNPDGMKYFEDQDISQANPLFTKVWGDITSTTVTHEETVESAFGAPTVNVTSRTFRSWDVVGASAEPMEFDSEATLTKDELDSLVKRREEYLAGIKKRQEERNASKSGQTGFPAPASNVKSTTDDSEDFPF